MQVLTLKIVLNVKTCCATAVPLYDILRVCMSFDTVDVSY